MENCLNCGNKLSIRKASLQNRKYCSLQCKADFEYKRNVQDWLSGVKTGSRGKALQLCNYIRRYLFETRGTACEECGWDERHPEDGAILTEIDHIDGNAENNKVCNLKILCPCCHAMTPTFRSRNRTSKRKR